MKITTNGLISKWAYYVYIKCRNEEVLSNEQVNDNEECNVTSEENSDSE